MCGTHGPEMVHVHHPGAGEALVPRTALAQMDPEWRILGEDEPAPAAEDVFVAVAPPEPVVEPEATGEPVSGRSRRRKKTSEQEDQEDEG